MPGDTDINETDARLALDRVEQRRREVIAEIDMPRWYWWGVALGWLALGAITDYAAAWLAAAATLVFGAVHSAVAQRVLSGRHGSRRLSVRAEVAGRHIPALVIGFLLAMVAATVVLALVASADGARHPVTLAGATVAAAVLAGGPRIMAAARRRLADPPQP